MRILFVRALWPLGLVCSALVHAQTLPDAGSLRQQIERGFDTTMPGPAVPLAPAEPAPLRMNDGMMLDVRAFRFAGNTLLNDGELQGTVQSFAGRRLSFAELQQAVQAVAQRYREAGWIVRTYLPQQDVTEGIVTIQVVEAVFSGAYLADPLPSRIKSDTLLAYVAAQQATGTPLAAAALDRALLLADDLPGVAVAGALEPGQRDGETALVLTARDEAFFSGDAMVDNAGSRATGAERLLLSARLASPLRRGDQLRADFLHSRGTDYGRLAYGIPLGADGWRLGVNASAFNYRLVGSDFAALDGKGGSSSAGVELSYPLVRSRLRNLYLTTGYQQNRFRNEANGTVQSRYRTHNLNLGLAGNLYDDVWGGGANSGALTLIGGRLSQGALDVGENPDVAGRFGKLRYSLSRQQVLSPRLSLMGMLNGQHTNKDLDSSERFYLGGPTGVRAYPVNEAGGSRGQLLNLEVRWRAVPGVTLAGFYDWGRVRSDTTAPNAVLKGYGVSVDWAGPQGLGVKAIVARRAGHNPHPTATGKDQDGSLRRTRFWLMANLAF